MDEKNEIIDKLSAKQCYVVDVLPKRVSANSKALFFEVEEYFLENLERYRLQDKFICIVLKLMCYYQTSILFDDWLEHPTVEMIAKAVKETMDNHSESPGTLNILFPSENMLLVIERDCLNMSVYNAEEDMRKLVSRLAEAEGLFLWKAENENVSCV